MFDFLKKTGRNEYLNGRLRVLHANMENNYKDAAQLDFKQIREDFEQLKTEGKLSAKDQAYYQEQINAAEKELMHFTHFEGPGTGRYHSV